MKYLMVTIKKDAFNSCGLFEQVYPKKMLNDNITPDNAVPNSECIFINKTLKKMFTGIFLNVIRVENENIYFKIKINSEIQFDSKYDKYGGWYLLQDYNFDNLKKIEKVKENSIISYNNSLIPPFFSELKSTEDYRKFENLTYFLLKCLGINEIIKIDPNRAGGRSDGFFKILNFAVIYDSKLNSAYRQDMMQIRNYCDQLQSGLYKYSNQSYSFLYSTKSVWIITRGKTELIENYNGIKIKEVSIDSLIKLYIERLEYYLSEHDLEQKLINI